MKMKNSSLLLLLIMVVSACAIPEEKEACHLIEHPDIDLTLKSMDDYAAMNWEDHRASYTEDGTVRLNSLDPDKLKGIDESIEAYKAQRESGAWIEFFWTGRYADRMILDYPDLDPEAWVFVWGNWNGILAESGDTVTAAVHIANRMSAEGLIRYHYVNIDRAPIVTALSKE
jgi:hypothetical protein